MSDTPKPRHCIKCGAEIFASMGSCNSADVFLFTIGWQEFIRETCGLCVMRQDLAEHRAEYEEERLARAD